MPYYVFVHVPRTAGSSVWHHLAHQGADQQIGVFDIYHESIQRCGLPGCSEEFLPAVLHSLDMPRCFFHHHSRENIFGHFAGFKSVFATLLRDPVDRFISDIFHLRKYIRSAAGTGRLTGDITRFWSEQFVADICRDDVTVGDLLEQAARVPGFRNFYLQFFTALCFGPPRRDFTRSWPVDYSSQEIRELALEVRRRFQVVGWFGDLHQSFAEIQQAFTLRPGSASLTNTINASHDRPPLRSSEWSRHAAAFDGDYQFLDELRVLSGFRKSVRQLLRHCRPLAPASLRLVDETLPLDAVRFEPGRVRSFVAAGDRAAA